MSRGGYAASSPTATSSNGSGGYNVEVPNDVIRAAEAALVIELVNAFGTLPRATRGEAQAPYPRPAPFLRATIRTTDAQDVPAIREADLVELADALHSVFANASHAQQPEAVEVLNGLLAEAAAVPHLSPQAAEPDAPRSDWLLVPQPGSGDRACRALRAACAVGLYQWLTQGGSLERLGVCHAHGCDDVYVDGTQAASRRYCSSTCSSRAKVAALRARRRLGSDGPRSAGRSRRPPPSGP